MIAAAIARKKAKEAAAKAPAEAPAKGAKKAPVVEEDDDGEAPPTTKVTGKGGKAPATPAKPAAVSPAVAGVLGKWADDDE